MGAIGGCGEKVGRSKLETPMDRTTSLQLAARQRVPSLLDSAAGVRPRDMVKCEVRPPAGAGWLCTRARTGVATSGCGGSADRRPQISSIREDVKASAHAAYAGRTSSSSDPGRDRPPCRSRHPRSTACSIRIEDSPLTAAPGELPVPAAIASFEADRREVQVGSRAVLGAMCLPRISTVAMFRDPGLARGDRRRRARTAR